MLLLKIRLTTPMCSWPHHPPRRVNFVTGVADGATSKASAGDQVGPDATAGGHFGSNSINGDPNAPGNLASARLVMNGVRGDCGTLATLMKYELDLIGATGASVQYVHACHANWDSLLGPAEKDGERVLGMWFGDVLGLGYGWNNYEGCCEFEGKWWEGGNGVGAASAVAVLHDSCDPNVSGATNSHQCWSGATSVAVGYP